MAEGSNPDVNSGDKKLLSRRDFLKLAGIGLGALALRPKLVEIGDNLEKEAVLMGAQRFLIKNEDVPPGVENVPLKNEHFMFADEILERALSQYDEWALRENLPRPFFRKSDSYFDYGNPDFFINLAQFSSKEYLSFIKNLFGKNTLIPDKSSFWNKYLELVEHFFGNFEGYIRGYGFRQEKFGSSPISFSTDNAYDPAWILYFNPGSPILNRVCKNLKITDRSSINTDMNHKIREELHKEIDPVWSDVDEYVKITKSPMTLDMFLARLFYRNKGDISGSLWDAALLTKIGSRNDHGTFNFNSTYYRPEFLASSAKRDTDEFLRRLQDSFSPRLSANWVNDNVRKDRLFAYSLDDPGILPHNYKPFDRYSATGSIYHGLGIMALGTITGPEVPQSMMFYENFLSSPTGKIRPAPGHGLEKVTADLFVAYRAPEVRKILDKYSA